MIDLVTTQLRRRIAQEFYLLDRGCIKPYPYDGEANAVIRSATARNKSLDGKKSVPIYDLASIFANAEEEEDQYPALRQLLRLVSEGEQHVLVRGEKTVPLCIALYRWLLWTGETKAGS